LTSTDRAVTTTWLDSLDGLRQSWNELAQKCPTSHPQYLYDWVEPWWRLVGSRQRALFSVRVDLGDRTFAIAPLMLVRRRARGLVTLREVQWLASGTSDQEDIISAGPAREAGAAVADLLIRFRRSWDELHLECVPEASEAVEGLLDGLRGGLNCTVSVKRAPSYYIDTSGGDWAAYLATTSKKFVRRDLPRVRRRLEELGELAIRHERGADVGDLMTVAAAIHRARQDELGRESGLADERYAAFVAEALEGLSRLGMLSVWTLQVGQDIGAYLIGFETGGVFYAWNMAHNPAYSTVSPGKVLWASAIQGCFEDKTISEFNMMRGDTDYKLKWTNVSRDLLDIRVRNLATVRSALLNRMRRSAG
jgi:CelD/BcsL family acetyltransferase involved in cellulose biosynthesis